MKFAIIGLLLLFFAGMTESYGNELRASFKLRTRWAFTPIKSAKGLEIQQFQRYIKIPKGAIPAASTTYMRIIEEGKSQSIKQTLEGLKIGFGKQTSWEIDSVKNGKLAIGDWKSAHRQVRMMLFKPSPKELVIVSTIVRNRFKKSLEGEVELLEENILKRHKKAKVSLLDLVVPVAHAQFFPPIGPTSPTTTGPDPFTELSNDLNALKLELDQTQAESDEWQALMQDISDKWSIEMDELQSLMQIESDQWQVQMQNMSNDWLLRADRGLDIAEKLTDPEHLAKMGFGLGIGLGAGMALGTLAVNLVVDGVVLGLKALGDLILPFHDNRVRWENFAAAREAWEEGEEAALKLEQALTAFLAAFEKIDETRGEDLMASMNQHVDSLRFQSAEFLKKYNADSDCESCRRDYYQQHITLEREIEKYAEVLNYAREKGITSLRNSDSFFCNQLEELKRKINNAEMVLNKLRTNLVSGQAEWYRNQRKVFNERQDEIERLNRERARGEESQEARLSTRLLEKVRSEASKMDKDIPNGWMERCLDGSSEVGTLINAELGRNALFRTARIRTMCKEAYANIFAELHRESREDFDALLAEANEQAEYQYQNARFRQIYDNPNAEMQHIIDMERWFTKLEYELECVGQMHKASEGYVNACRTLNPKMVALREANVKANDVWNQRCDDGWRALQEEFQGYHEGYSEAEQVKAMNVLSSSN